MPPWLPEPGYGEFAGQRRLTADQIATIGRWVEQGAVEGDRSLLPPPPQLSTGWQLGEPDLVVKVARPFTLEPGGMDVWRNFVIPIPISQARFVKTVELRPGSPRFVHHALIGIDETGSSRRRDGQDVEVGFEGMDMGEAHTPDGSLLGWTPGMLPFPGIEGAAWRLEPGTDLVLQLHMMPSTEPQSIEPVIGLHYANAPVASAPMYLLLLDADDALDIPPGARDFVVTDQIELPVATEVFAIYPHAHYVGASIESWATLPDGTRRWLIKIPRWDFKWQDVYRYAAPVALPKGTTVTMRWTYDNSTEHPHHPGPPKRVVAGNGSSDEMAHLQLQVRVQGGMERAVLQEAHYRHFLARNPRNARFLYGLASALKDQGRLADAVRQYRAVLAADPEHVSAHINLGAMLLEQGSADEGVEHFRAAVRLEPDSAGAHYNLGFVFAARGQFDESAARYREAIRLRPGFAAAHNNLGRVLGVQGRLNDAVTHFREALRLVPESAEVHNNLGAVLQLQGKAEEAISHFRQALAIDPGHANARDNLNAAVKAAAAALPPRAGQR